MTNKSYAKMILNTLNSNDFAFKMQHKTSFCVKLCCILMPRPLLSQAGEALHSRYPVFVSIHWGEAEGQTGKFVIKIHFELQHIENQIINFFNVLKLAKMDRK
jgi:hypothetical protein